MQMMCNQVKNLYKQLCTQSAFQLLSKLRIKPSTLSGEAQAKPTMLFLLITIIVVMVGFLIFSIPTSETVEVGAPKVSESTINAVKSDAGAVTQQVMDGTEDIVIKADTMSAAAQLGEDNTLVACPAARGASAVNRHLTATHLLSTISSRGDSSSMSFDQLDLDDAKLMEVYRTLTDDEVHEKALILESVNYNYDELLSIEYDILSSM